MKQEAVLDYFILNHQLRSTRDMSIFDRITQQSVYEVVKVVAGLPVFFEEHMQRMRCSAALLKDALPKSDEEVLEEICLLLEKNRCENIMRLYSGEVNAYIEQHKSPHQKLKF